MVGLLLSVSGCVETGVGAFGPFDAAVVNEPAVEGVTDRFQQSALPAVDVLWVVDNSASMTPEQRALTQNFRSFIRSFQDSDIDFHVGVVTTGYEEPAERGVLRHVLDDRGNRRAWVTADDPEPAALFAELADVGTMGPRDEMGRAQVFAALELNGDGINAGFVRDDADLSIIVVSDSDDLSEDSPIGRLDFVDWLAGFKAEPDRVSFSSIVAPEEGCGDALPGLEYLYVTDAIGGVKHDICDPGWSILLEDLGHQTAGLQDEFVLTQLPDLDTLEVTLEHDGATSTLARDLHYEYLPIRNAVRVLEVPPAGSQVVVRYQRRS